MESQRGGMRSREGFGHPRARRGVPGRRRRGRTRGAQGDGGLGGCEGVVVEASCGRFKEARDLAAAAKALAAESEAAERGPRSRRGALGRASGRTVSARGPRTARCTARRLERLRLRRRPTRLRSLKPRRAYCNRILLRKVFRAWAEYSEWLKPLRAKAGRALSLFKNNSVGRTFYAWMDYAKEERARREVDAVRAYMDIHQGLISKHIRRGRAPLGEKVNVASSARRGAYGSFRRREEAREVDGRALERGGQGGGGGWRRLRRQVGEEASRGLRGRRRGGRARRGSWVAGGVDAWVATTARITDRSRM